MTFRLAKSESPETGFRRIALEETDALADGLTRAGGSTVALHEVRKGAKRIRALVALARDLFGPAAGAIDAELREVARTLGRFREADALHAVLAAEARAVGLANVEVLHAALRLHHEIAVTVEAGRERDAEVARARRVVLRMRRRIERAPMDGAEAVAFKRRIRKTYRRARRSFQAARSERTPEQIHLWRKRGKLLLNQIRLVRASGRALLSHARHELARMDNMLGRARDCEALAHILRGVPAAEEPLADGYGLRARLEAAAADLNTSAFRIGGGLFRRRSRAWLAAMFG